MNTYHNIKKPNYLVLRLRIFLACLLLPLFANAGDYPTLEYPTNGTFLEIRPSNPSDYTSLPRCGPRNCVAMCVTCFYDICRASGGTVKQCKSQMEYCKDGCYENSFDDPRNPYYNFPN